MTIEQIKGLHNELVNGEVFEEVQESEFVEEVNNCGNSSQYPSAVWFDIKLTDGTAIDLFIKWED